MNFKIAFYLESQANIECVSDECYRALNRPILRDFYRNNRIPK